MNDSPLWRKARRSDTQGNECVEIADLRGSIGIRDSKNAKSGYLTFEPAAFTALINKIKADKLDFDEVRE